MLNVKLNMFLVEKFSYVHRSGNQLKMALEQLNIIMSPNGEHVIAGRVFTGLLQIYPIEKKVILEYE